MAIDTKSARHSLGEAGVELIQSPFGAAPSGYGAQYDQLFAANPYRQQTYNKSFWQDVAGVLGFRTGYDDWMDQTSTQIAEYDAGIYSMMQQNKFNSPEQQAQRMREAGLNPDILGTGDVASAAQPVEDPNGMQPQQSDPFSKVGSLLGSFGRGLVNAFNIGMNIYKGIADVKKIQADINALSISNANSILDVVDKIIVGSVPLSVIEKGDNIDTFFNTIDMSKYGFTGSSLEAANTALNDRFDSIKNNADIRKAVYERYGNMAGTNHVQASGFIPENQMYDSPDDFFNLQIETMARAARRIMALKQSNEEFDATVLEPQQQANQFIEGEIQQERLGSLQEGQYGLEMASNELTTVQSDTFFKTAQSIINEERANMYAALKARADAGSSFATSMLHAMALQDMLSFDFSAGLDLSFLKGLSNIAGSLFSDIWTTNGKGTRNVHQEDQRLGNALRKTFGSGLNFQIGIKSK